MLFAGRLFIRRLLDAGTTVPTKRNVNIFRQTAVIRSKTTASFMWIVKEFIVLIYTKNAAILDKLNILHLH